MTKFQPVEQGDRSVQNLLVQSSMMNLEANNLEPRPTPTSPVPLRDARAEFDREYLSRVLRAAGGDVRRAASIAEIHPKSFERLMRRRGVRRP
jgi:DNA-binding NtrC family response regulator